MEELLELGLVVIVAVIGIVSKANKNKKKAQSKPASAWEAVGEKVLELMEDEESDEDEEEVDPGQIEMAIPYAPAQPAPPVAPAAVHQPVQPAAMHQPVQMHVPAARPVMPVQAMPSAEGMRSGEGDCDHPLHEPVRVPVRKPAVKESPALEVERHQRRAGFAPAGVNAAGLRQAVIMSEVLGKPVSLRGAGRR